jgi:hypothetical protein
LSGQKPSIKKSKPLAETDKANTSVVENVAAKKSLNSAKLFIEKSKPPIEDSAKSKVEFINHDSRNPFEEGNESTQPVLKSALKVSGAQNIVKSVNFNLEANVQFEFIEQSPEEVPSRPTPTHRASIFSKPARKLRKVTTTSDSEPQPSPMTPKHRALLSSRVALNVGRLLLETQSQTPIKADIESS